jgi:hypothetical protein
MSAKNIQIDWEDFDNRAIRDNRDRSKFSCDEPWEVKYLVESMLKQLPGREESSIRRAIGDCCKECKAPHPREEFVQCVLKKLK